MNTKKITSKAKSLHGVLMTAAASVSILGIAASAILLGITGCTRNEPTTTSVRENVRTVEHENLNHVLPNYLINSGSLTELFRDQFKVFPSDSSYLDMDLHHGYVETSDSDGIGSDRLADYTKDYKVDHHEQQIRYRINNKAKTITFSSNHVRNSLESITYKLSIPHVKGPMNQLRFKPVSLKRFGHKHSARVTGLVARHNRLYLSPTVKIVGGGAKSLNTVQRKRK